MEIRDSVLVCFITAALLFGCTGGPSNPPLNGENNENATITTNTTYQPALPIHKADEITAYLQKYLVVYYGIWGVDVPIPSYTAGEWKTDVVYIENGIPQTLRVSISDSNLTVNDMWLKVLLNKEPAGIVQIPGKLSCSEGGKVKVIEFANPYCPNCVAAEKSIGMFKNRFNGSIEYEYRVMLPKTNTMIETYGYSNVSLTSKYYLCAQRQGLLEGFRRCVMAKYAKQTGKPLEANWLNSCAIDEGLNLTDIKNCASDADKLLDADMKIGQTYLGDFAKLPTFVIDCRSKTSDPNLVRYAICYDFPNTAGC